MLKLESTGVERVELKVRTAAAVGRILARVQITWDRDKAAANLDKHGIDFHDAATVFTDPLSTTFPSLDHSDNESRFVTIGESTKRELLVVAHTEGDDIIRIISARRATRQETRFYEDKPT